MVADQDAIRRADDHPGAIDYRLAREVRLARFRRGDLALNEVCDAHAELRRAAAHCSQPTDDPCPVCAESAIVLVHYVFGPRLPAFGRCVNTTQELQALARRRGSFTCYVVEVCTECDWNHLVRTYPLVEETT